jgi:radical SAM protein with 4Fe4S-binding SPASM domain
MSATVYKMVNSLRIVAIELTNVCNLKCWPCWAQNPHLRPARPRGFMTEETFTNVLNQFKSHYRTSIMVISLSYSGESLLHPKFTEYLKRAHEVGFKNIQLATNGILLNQKIAEALVDANVEIAVSLHKSPHLNKSINNAKVLYAEKKRKGSTASIRANVIYEEFTEAELADIGKAMEGHCDLVKVFYMIPEDLHVDEARSRNLPMCQYPFFYMAILWDGETLPCCHMISPGTFTLGNVVEKSMRTVFRDKPYRMLREARYAGTPCEVCNVWKKGD